MKIFNRTFHIFPRKIKVTVGLKSGKTFYFYCDEFSWSESKGWSFSGAPVIAGTRRPTIDIICDDKGIEYISHEQTRLFHIYWS